MARLRRLSGVAVVVLAAIGLALVFVAPAVAEPVASGHVVRNPPGSGAPPRGDYLSLGDSVPFGFSPYVDPRRANHLSFPDLVARSLHLHLTNAACPGETTTSLIGTSTPAASNCETGARPPHVSYSKSQLAYASSYLRHHPRTGLVSLMIGANDMFAATSPEQGLNTVRHNLPIILSAIRRNYDGPLVVVTYYSLDYNNRALSAVTRQLNAVVRAQARKAGAVVADGYRAFGLVSLLAPRQGDPCSARLLIHVNRQVCDIHPSDRGAAVLALAVDAAVLRKG